MERVVVEVDVVEVGSLVGGKVDADADAMLQQLSETGRVALYGMYFDTGKSVLTPASEPTLTDVVALLNGNPGLSLYVVGHTDMVGSLSSNLDLSQRRAAAVVDALVAAGIARGRLEAYGAGPVAPVAENVTEAGRARNRRVELVVR
jgi:outer membrane protein OmpA-like peptidoglycan-associated protein